MGGNESILSRIAKARESLTADRAEHARHLVVPDPASRFEPYPQSDLQQAYWFAHLASGPIAGGAFTWSEYAPTDDDLPHLEPTWQALAARHDTLRSSLRSDGMWQVARELPAIKIETTDLRGLPVAQREAELARLRSSVTARAPELTSWPLLSMRLARMEGESRLFMNGALSLLDWNSYVILGREGEQIRNGQRLAPNQITYRDYAMALARLHQTPMHARALEYWLARAASLPAGPSLPLRREPAAYHWIEREHVVPRPLYDALVRRAATAGITTSVLFMAALGDVLAAWSTNHFTLTMLLQNRLPLHPQVEGLVGNLTGTLPIDIDIVGSETFVERARRLQSRLEADLEHRWLNGVALAREINRARGTSAPLSRVVFSSRLSSPPIPNRTWIGRLLRRGMQTADVWLDVQLMRNERGDAIAVFAGREDLYVPGLIDDLTEANERLLRRLAEDDDAWRDPHPVVLGSTQLDARARANATVAPVPSGLLHAPVHATAARIPEHPAVITPERTLTYGELVRMSNVLARQLVERGVGPGQLVAVVMEKGWEQVVAVLGILEAGAAYLPIDLRLIPQKRVELLLRHGNVRVAITQATVEIPPDVETISIDRDFGASAHVVALPPRAQPQDLAYVIYTSGSTGTPKGVMIDHRGALNTCVDIASRFGIAAGDRVLGLSSLSFDLSVFDIFGVLGIGGVLVLPAPASMRSPDEWLELVGTAGVTVWNSVPKLLEMMVDYIGERRHLWPTSLRVAMLSGDWIPLSLARRVQALGPDVSLVSLGGATEASIWSCYHEIQTIEPDWVSIPYGRALANQTLHVFNAALRPTPVWVTGEIYIGGIGVALGYWQDPERTAAAFSTHPETGERLYRTGDVGRVLPTGEVEFLGRRDAQVKIRGYRIELGEIETTLASHPDVAQCYVMAREADASAAKRRGDRTWDTSTTAAAARIGTDKKLVAYVVPAPSRSLDREVLRQFAAQQLPDYMVPSVIMVLDAIPLSPNGKVDRRALPAPEASAAGDHELPADMFDRAAVDLMSEFFSRRVGLAENFFEAGGDSVRLIKLLARVRQRFGREVRVSDFLVEPTARALSQLIRVKREPGLRHVVPLRAGTSGLPICFIHPVGGTALVYMGLAEALGGDRQIYGIQARGLEEDGEPIDVLGDMVTLYADELVAAIPDGPIVLAGWSLGGTIALQVARRLSAAGRQVPLVALLDSWAPRDASAAAHHDDVRLVEWFLRDVHGRLDWAGPIVHAVGDRKQLVTHAHEQGLLPVELSVEEALRRLRVYIASSAAARVHVPEPWSGRTLLLRAAELPGVDFLDHPALRSPALDDATSGWSATCSNLEVRTIPGNHYTLLSTEHLPAVAAALDEALRGAETTGEPS